MYIRRLSKITSRIKSRATREERSRARAVKVGRVHSESDSQSAERVDIQQQSGKIETRTIL